MARAKKPKQPKPRVLKEEERFLRAGGGYTTDVRQSLGAHSHRPTPPEYLLEGEEIPNEPEPTPVPADIQKRFTDEAQARGEVLRAKQDRREVMRSRIARMRQLVIELERKGAQVDTIGDMDDLMERWEKAA